MTTLTDAKLFRECVRCEYCEERPCQKACPANCSPTDFIMAARVGEPSDFKRAAGLIMSKNPFGGVCGAVCPERFCMKACVHKTFDHPINIPKIQETIVKKAKDLRVMPEFKKAQPNGKTIAIVGAGPAGLTAAAMLVQKGYKVIVYDKDNRAGGSCWAIPDPRLNKEILANDLEFIMGLGDITLKLAQEIDDQGMQKLLTEYSALVVALGKKGTLTKITDPRVFYAGDFINGHTSVVQAVASGKIAALAADAYMKNEKYQLPESNLQNADELCGAIETPVSLETDFFGRKICSPFLLSAGPSTDGYENMKKAYQAGWAGGVVKTAFDNVPIHIPNEYMFVYDDSTYANCDNVSEHPLDRVCKEISQLVKEFPDRLTIGGTGGSVTGNDQVDKKSWQSNTLKLERAGAMAVEYSLSCPQGGDCAEGAIVSQNAKLTAKIIDWVMEVSAPEIPKLFKLTSAVASTYSIVAAVKAVFQKYPHKKAGITLANSFPSLGFRKIDDGGKKWDEGVVAGMAGAGVEHISYLALAGVAPLGIAISGNGGAMNYKAAANFLALGTNTVQVCTVVMKQGLGVVNELNSGLSHLLQAKGLSSISELVGRALPNPITDFMALSPIKKVSSVIPELCEHCGNCTRCPYMAIKLDENKIPQIDAAKCIGCSICVKKCFAGALRMRERRSEEQNLKSGR